MIVHAPESSLGWLDFDAAASARVGELLRSLEEPSTLDQLGLGGVGTAFSEMLSPGTTTTQTRLRYFIFVPWICSRLEAQRVAPGDFARRLREDEARLIDCLRHLGPSNGVIGYSAGRDLKLMPSWLYWGGLGAWGLRRLDLSIAEYGQRAAALGRLQPERDDDRNATAPTASMWAPMPPAPDDFLRGDITFELRRDEAQVLVDCIRRHHPGTLLAFLSGAPAAAASAGLPWEVPTAGMPEGLVELLRHARCFSELTLGPQLVYNVLLARKAREEFGWDTAELEQRQLRRLDGWAELLTDRHAELRSWVENLPEFWHVLAEHRIGGATQDFVHFVARRAVEAPEGFAEDRSVHDSIIDREFRLKSKRARLSYRAALENWGQVPGGGHFDYRWPITKRYLADLARALGTAP
ncbi:MAG: DUF6361 family protein [bacterium]|nr:DUF6361 family protein [bacterium]